MSFNLHSWFKKQYLKEEKYKSFNTLSDKDLEDIAQWGLNGEFDFSACESVECVVKSFKESLSVSYPEGLGNVSNELEIYRIIRLKDEKDLNISNLGKSWFSNSKQYNKPEFFDSLSYLKDKKTDKGEIYLLKGLTKISNVDIPRTLWQRSITFFENEIVIKNPSQVKLLKINKI